MSINAIIYLYCFEEYQTMILNKQENSELANFMLDRMDTVWYSLNNSEQEYISQIIADKNNEINF